MRKRYKNTIVLTAASVLCLYIGCYFFMSIAGAYRIYGRGLIGHYGYNWTPYGFINRLDENNEFIWFFFFPLWRMDCSLWHKHTDFPPTPPPFTQDGIAVFPPLFLEPPVEWLKKGSITQLNVRVKDAKAREFTIVLYRSSHGIIKGKPIYIIPEGDTKRKVEVKDHSTFFARIFDFIEEKPARVTSPDG